MAQEAIAVLGNPTNGRAAMESLLAEFEWSVENILTVDGLAEVCTRRDVVAVLVDPAVLELSWQRALAAVQAVAPRALPILCDRFSSAIDWSEASSAGAFHMLSLPLDLGELRQSLGFVWEAEERLPKRASAFLSPSPCARLTGFKGSRALCLFRFFCTASCWV